MDEIINVKSKKEWLLRKYMKVQFVFDKKLSFTKNHTTYKLSR